MSRNNIREYWYKMTTGGGGGTIAASVEMGAISGILRGVILIPENPTGTPTATVSLLKNLPVAAGTTPLWTPTNETITYWSVAGLSESANTFSTPATATEWTAGDEVPIASETNLRVPKPVDQSGGEATIPSVSDIVRVTWSGALVSHSCRVILIVEDV